MGKRERRKSDGRGSFARKERQLARGSSELRNEKARAAAFTTFTISRSFSPKTRADSPLFPRDGMVDTKKLDLESSGEKRGGGSSKVAPEDATTSLSSSIPPAENCSTSTSAPARYPQPRLSVDLSSTLNQHALPATLRDESDDEDAAGTTTGKAKKPIRKLKAFRRHLLHPRTKRQKAVCGIFWIVLVAATVCFLIWGLPPLTKKVLVPFLEEIKTKMSRPAITGEKKRRRLFFISASNILIIVFSSRPSRSSSVVVGRCRSRRRRHREEEDGLSAAASDGVGRARRIPSEPRQGLGKPLGHGAQQVRGRVDERRGGGEEEGLFFRRVDGIRFPPSISISRPLQILAFSLCARLVVTRL